MSRLSENRFVLRNEPAEAAHFSNERASRKLDAPDELASFRRRGPPGRSCDALLLLLLASESLAMAEPLHGTAGL